VDELSIYVGLDVHKDTIAVAVAEEGNQGEVREHGKIANTAAALTKLVSKLANCEFQRKPPTYSDLMAPGILISSRPPF